MMVISDHVAARVEEAIAAYGFTPAQSCWPLCAFGWVDSHHEPGGCCGISRILFATSDEVHVAAGGHAFCKHPNSWPGIEKMEHSRVRLLSDAIEQIIYATGYQVDFHRRQWILRTDSELIVPVHIYGWPDWQTTASDIVSLAKNRLRPFHEACLDVHKQIAALVERLENDKTEEVVDG